jgi:hypothetical protein
METFIGQGPTPGMGPGGGRPTLALTASGLRIAGGDGLNGGAAADSFLLDISFISILLSSNSGFDFSLSTAPRPSGILAVWAETVIGSILVGRDSSGNCMPDFALFSAFAGTVESENSVAAPQLPPLVGS